MKGDFSRSTFRKKKHYRKVKMQQGRVQVDADWNEQIDIQDYHDRISLQDIIGKSGAPIEDDGGFKIIPSDQGYRIGKGRYYVDGILIENEEEVEALNQPDLPILTQDDVRSVYPIEPGIYLAYLDVWERHLTALDDPEIQESALGGADTATRSKIVWQVKVHRVDDEIIGGRWNDKWDLLGRMINTLRIAVGSNKDGRLEVFGHHGDGSDYIGHIAQTEPNNSEIWKYDWNKLLDESGNNFIGYNSHIVGSNKDGRLEVFGENDALIWHTRQTDVNSEIWKSNFNSLGSNVPGRPSFFGQQIAVGSNADGRLEVFGIGDEDKAVYHIAQTVPDSENWGNWKKLSQENRKFNQIAVGSNADGRLEVFGSSDDETVYHIAQTVPDSENWGINWKPLGDGDKKIIHIAVGSNKDGRLEVFGYDYNNEGVYNIAQTVPDSDNWDSWKQLGDRIRKFNQIAVGSNKDGRLEVFGIGYEGDGAYHIAQTTPNSDNWDSWSNLGERDREFNQIAVGSNKDGRLEVFGIGYNNEAVYHIAQKKLEMYCLTPIPSWDSMVKPSNRGTLQARSKQEIMSNDPCTLSPGAGYRRLENQLYRIEIHDSGEVVPQQPAPPAGTLPLYRYYNAANGDHFYTMNKAEGDNAVQTGGYTHEGISGYLYPSTSIP
jgi:hypothetical protein